MTAAGGGQAQPPWWGALPPAEAEVACGADTHRLLWEEGRLTARDHTDVEGELVLGALGGEQPECVDLIESWGSFSDDLEVLAVGPRSAADELTISPEFVAELRARGSWGLLLSAGGRRVAYASTLSVMRGPRPLPWPSPGGGWAWLTRRAARLNAALALNAARAAAVRNQTGPVGLAAQLRHGPPGSRARRSSTPFWVGDQADRAGARRADLLSLLVLGPEFQWRLSATVAAAWADGGSRAGDRDAARPALVAALAGRLAPAARSWLGIDPGQVEVSLHEGAGWGRLEGSGTGCGRLRAALPASWLASVWAAGLAVTAGHLIVEISDVAWPEATVLGVPEPGADPVILKVRATGGRWTRAASGAETTGSGTTGNGA